MMSHEWRDIACQKKNVLKRDTKDNRRKLNCDLMPIGDNWCQQCVIYLATIYPNPLLH